MQGVEEGPVPPLMGAEGSVADQIRALDSAGHTRADIARLLGKRYQHVRNVLEGDKVRPPPAPPRDDGVAFRSGTSRLIVGPHGTVVLPAAILAPLGLKAGDVLVAQVREGGISLTEGLASARRAQQRIRTLLPAGDSLADELIAERRDEAARVENG